MCGRFVRDSGINVFLALVGLPATQAALTPRYNITPSNALLSIRYQHDGSDLSWCSDSWGLIPSWAKNHKYKPINARCETVAEKPFFRSAFKKRRSLICANGWYEWRKTEKGKQPYYIHLPDHQPFFFAGFWENWEGDDGLLSTTIIITTPANDKTKFIHDRMPLILQCQQAETWLDKHASTSTLQRLFVASQHNDIQFYPVSNAVNNPKNDDASLISEVDV